MIESWVADPLLNNMSGLALKIRYLKKKVKDWTRDRAHKLKRDYLDVVDEISSLLSSCLSGILS